MRSRTRNGIALTAAICCLATGSTALAQDIYLGKLSWPDAEFTTQLVATLIEDEFGLEVAIIQTGDRTLFDGLAYGDFDATVTAALPNEHAELWSEFGENIALLGVLYSVDVGDDFERVHALARADFHADYPVIADFLIRLHIPLDELEEATSAAQQTSAEEAVTQYIESHPARIEYWLTGGVGPRDQLAPASP